MRDTDRGKKNEEEEIKIIYEEPKPKATKAIKLDKKKEIHQTLRASSNNNNSIYIYRLRHHHHHSFILFFYAKINK